MVGHHDRLKETEIEPLSEGAISLAYKEALAKDIARQLRGFHAMCKCFGWSSAEKYITIAHEHILKNAAPDSKNRSGR